MIKIQDAYFPAQSNGNTCSMCLVNLGLVKDKAIKEGKRKMWMMFTLKTIAVRREGEDATRMQLDPSEDFFIVNHSSQLLY